MSFLFIKLRAQNPENIFKLHPVNFYFGSFSLGYERILDSQNTFDFGLGIPLGHSVSGEMVRQVIYEDYTLTDSKISNFHVRAAFRHYTSQKQDFGFYYEPYLKYESLSPDLEGESIDDRGTLEGKMNTFVGGFQIGYQFLLGKRFTLDLYFIGIEAGIGNVDLKGHSVTDMEGYSTDIQEAVAKIPYYGDHIVVEVVDDELRVHASNLFTPLYRTGFSLGIAF